MVSIITFVLGFVLGGGIVYFLMGQMKLHFENTANKIFKESSSEFSNQNREKLDEFFSKFKEKIEDFEKRTDTNFKEESEKFTQFDTNIKTFIEAGSKISHDTNALVNVMKGDNRRQGRWGEIVLEKVLEASGLRCDEEYTLQKGMDERRPDATILLPENRCVYVDAKTSFASWDAYVNCEDEEQKELNFKAFKESTKAHITGLAKKSYQELGEMQSPDYVLMFIPIESCYQALFTDDCALWDFAWKNKIMPVSPSTMLAALKIINAFHVVNRQNKNAVEISRLCTKMLDKFADMLKDILNARKNIVSALKRLDGRDSILVNIEKLGELGATMTKSIPELPEDVLED